MTNTKDKVYDAFYQFRLEKKQRNLAVELFGGGLSERLRKFVDSSIREKEAELLRQKTKE